MNIARLANGNFSDLFLLPFDNIGLARDASRPGTLKSITIYIAPLQGIIPTSRLTLRAEKAEDPISYSC